MKFNLMLAVAVMELLLRIVMFILLCFGSLLWPLSIIAVLWGFYDGFMPAIQKREFVKATVILGILLVTCIVIIISLHKAVYLTAFIVPVILVYIYIKRFVRPVDEIITDFSKN